MLQSRNLVAGGNIHLECIFLQRYLTLDKDCKTTIFKGKMNTFNQPNLLKLL